MLEILKHKDRPGVAIIREVRRGYICALTSKDNVIALSLESVPVELLSNNTYRVKQGDYPMRVVEDGAIECMGVLLKDGIVLKYPPSHVSGQARMAYRGHPLTAHIQDLLVELVPSGTKEQTLEPNNDVGLIDTTL